MGFTVQESDFKPIPPNTPLAAVVESLKVVTIPYVDKQTQEKKTFDKCEWWFKITSGEFKGRKVKGETSAVIDNHPSNKFRLWVESLLNMPIPVGFSFDEEDVMGLPCEITTVQNTLSDGRVFDNVESVNPASQQSEEPPF